MRHYGSERKADPLRTLLFTLIALPPIIALGGLPISTAVAQADPDAPISASATTDPSGAPRMEIPEKIPSRKGRITYTAPMPATGDFRSFVWGVTEDDVMSYETARFYRKEKESLYFVEQFSANDWRHVVRYDFTNGRLSSASFHVQDLTYPNSGKVMEDYEDMRRTLAKQYGKPVREDLLWVGSKRYEAYPQFWGRALLGRDLKIETEYRTATTQVILRCHYLGDFYFLGYTVLPIVERDPNEDILKLPGSAGDNKVGTEPAILPPPRLLPPAQDNAR